jgi:flagellar protein FlbD
MIKLTRLDNSNILINPDLIEHIELNNDSVITLTNGRSFVVQESSEEIEGRIIQFKRKCFECPAGFHHDDAGNR